ncbi:prostaglandin reductase 1-like [Arctopsyche grandis]|uniref:prostaglandin reductase 1-like n=1 Tax=Arctopsyche grandis TaxID=121162 RepID=UPI00406D9B7A
MIVIMASNWATSFAGFARAFSTSSSRMVKARKYLMVTHFQGEPKKTDLKLVEEELPSLADGEFLCKAKYLSVDPYMRPYMMRYPVGSLMIGSQVAEIVESKSSKFPVGKLVVGSFGWRDYTISDDKESENKPYILPDFGDLSPSLGLGVLGMPGNTAYFGFLEICRPKPNETVVITGAAGAVGSHVGQIAKLKGCRVIGFAGSDEKCNWLKNQMGFDYAYNYKKVNPDQALKESAHKGVDCYFDNVGGELSSAIINRMNTFGRISVCGAISVYNTDISKMPKVPILQPTFVFNQLKMEGFLVTRWLNRWNEGIGQNLKWIKEGKLKHKETVTDGFENMFEAFTSMLRGENTGKAIVKV